MIYFLSMQKKSKAVSQSAWREIKTEYVETDISLRALEKKYGIPFSAIREKSVKEDWKRLREERKDAVYQNQKSKLDEMKADNDSTVRAFKIAFSLLDKIEESVAVIDPADTSSIKQLTTSLKDLKEIGVFRARLDEEEQKARILKLQKEVKNDEEQTKIEVTFASGVDDYAD